MTTLTNSPGQVVAECTKSASNPYLAGASSYQKHIKQHSLAH